MTWFYAFDLFGVAVFAISGALVAGRKSMDLFGVLVIALITSLGGGTLRDAILDHHPVSWIRNDIYILVAVLAAIATIIWVRFTRPIHETGLLVADAFGLAIFTVIGTQVAMQHEVPISAAVIMGVMTGVAGGVMRDIICNEIPLIFQKEIYATACIAGSLVYIVMHQFQTTPNLDVTVAVLTVLVIRLAAIRWHLGLPRFHLLDREPPDRD